MSTNNKHKLRKISIKIDYDDFINATLSDNATVLDSNNNEIGIASFRIENKSLIADVSFQNEYNVEDISGIGLISKWINQTDGTIEITGLTIDGIN